MSLSREPLLRAAESAENLSLSSDAEIVEISESRNEEKEESSSTAPTTGDAKDQNKKKGEQPQRCVYIFVETAPKIEAVLLVLSFALGAEFVIVKSLKPLKITETDDFLLNSFIISF